MKTQARQLSSKMEEDVDGIHREYAAKFLGLIRAKIAKHNTGRHKLAISAGMGVAVVTVNGRMHWAQDCWRVMPIVQTLREIEDELDWTWAAYLNGAALN